MPVAIIAEKPSVARDIAAVLGADRNESGSLVGRGYVVTWAVGHLVGLAEPHEIDPTWKAWREDRLPMIPSEWPLKVITSARKQFEIVKKILNHPSIDRVVCATDAGREGELIFRYIYRLAACRKPVARLWISSLTPDAIRDGFAKLRPAREFDALADSAEGRSRADWLVGMNLTRAYTLMMGGELFSVGRVQTPTLAMIVDREIAIRDFVPEPYIEVKAQFGPDESSYWGTWFDPARARRKDGEGPPPERLPADGELARAICERCKGKEGKIASLQGTEKSMPPPLLHDLTELQRQANRLYGMTAGTTLTTAQALYEKHKLISYPRTDSRHLSRDVAATLQPIVEAIAPQYAGLVADGSGTRPLSRRYVDDAKVTDHHAIIPTGGKVGSKSLTRDEQRIYDLICRRLLMAWHADLKTRTTRVVTRVESEQAVDSFVSSGTVVLQAGWKVLDVQTSRAQEEPLLPSDLKEGQSRPVLGLELQNKQTAPPKRFTDATLLTAMETAGKCLDDRELEQAMRDRGLGTPATRAAIIETLLDREYVSREGKSLHATDKGIALIQAAHEKVKSPAMTGEWEHALKRIEMKEETLPSFMSRIEKYVEEVVGEVKNPRPGRMEPRPSGSGPSPATTEQRVEPRPSGSGPSARGWSTSPTTIASVLQTHFGHSGFRPYQEEVCEAVAQGEDALVVMPTGSGKSLCYQVPGIARGATTLVISPLIALMEDQTARLRALGLKAERIHSGRPREESREACRAYLRGDLHFLMIAPERLSVPGFPEMLARRKPGLIAIDEAHCISHWGHDFRPDYRLIGERIPMLRPSPIIAMTATATVRVQDDILAQLAIPGARRFIRGFRRDNLAVEIAEVPPAARLATTAAILSDPKRRPAIVYVPTRKAAEQYAQTLSRRMHAAAYHAGLPSDDRSRAQEGFLKGKLEVVVATIAFGMGVDKADVRTVVHAALPGTVEGYYQEIGRAGRDGLPSRAILMYSYADRRIHDSFLARDYPPSDVLQSVWENVPFNGAERELLVRNLGIDPEQARAAIDKLWVHGGVKLDAQDQVFRVNHPWKPSYEDIRAHRAEQLELVFEFAQSAGCRMLRLVRYFGDRDDRELCGVCDECAPAACTVKRFREPDDEERMHIERIVRALMTRDGLASGTLFRTLFEEEGVSRDAFEGYIDGMIRSHVAAAIEETFDKDGKSIRYRRVHLRAAPGASAASLAACVRLQEKVEYKPGKTGGRRRSRGKRPGPDLMVSTHVAPPKRRKPGKQEGAAPRSKPREAAAGPKAPRPDPLAQANSALVARLRAWRLAVAGQRRMPAYRVMTDEALMGIALARPRSDQELLQIKGVGPKIAERYGAALLQIVERTV
ncbi:MAG: DNA topoisomerase 3 [Deltaproteobacteria bacterium]|nr:DNA topoisomerase 3 [Deltaproteobacteria bacterium]